jgi:hypothetical protein
VFYAHLSGNELPIEISMANLALRDKVLGGACTTAYVFAPC